MRCAEFFLGISKKKIVIQILEIIDVKVIFLSVVPNEKKKCVRYVSTVRDKTVAISILFTRIPLKSFESEILL